MDKYLVIGGGSGIGAAIVERIIYLKSAVYIIDKKPPQVSPDGALGFRQADILDIAQTLPKIISLFQYFKFNGLVITAGGAHSNEVTLHKSSKEFWHTESETINETFQLNLINQMILINAILKISNSCLKTIVLTSSINSLGRYALPFYSAAKAGLEGYVRATAEQLGKTGIRINAVVPGSTKTPLTELEEMDFDQVIKQTALCRYNTPNDIADVVMLLLNSIAMTGQCIVVDSGQSLVGVNRY